MSDETTTEQLAEIDRDMADIERQVAELVEEAQKADYPQPDPQPQPQPVQVREGRWRTRSGEIKNIRACEPLKGAYYVWPWTDGFMTFQDNGRHLGSNDSVNDLVEYLGPIEPKPQPESQPESQPEPQPQPEPVPETTSEQWANIKEQADTEYTPPDGWRVLLVGERLRDGDMAVTKDGYCYSTERVGFFVGSNKRYIRPIEPEPQPQPESEPEPEPDAELRIRLLKQANDSQAETIGRLLTEARDLNMEIGGLERQLLQRDARIRDLETMHAAAAQAVVDAGKDNTALRNQLLAVKTELANVAADRQQLRVELDAAQQVPADSPELRQLRLDLAEVTQDRDTYRHAHERVLSDLETIRETTKAETVEAIVEWLEPVRATIEAADNLQQTMRADNLACDIIRNLPGILRYVVGLNHPEGIE